MKLYKVSVMTRVFGHEYFYQQLGDYTLVTDKERRFLLEVKPQPPKRKTTFVPTILDFLKDQKCELSETTGLVEWMLELRTRPEGELSTRTGIILPYGEAGADVLLTQNDRIVIADKDQLDVFNWYELFVESDTIKGVYCDGTFFVNTVPYDLSTKPKIAKTIALLNETR